MRANFWCRASRDGSKASIAGGQKAMTVAVEEVPKIQKNLGRQDLVDPQIIESK